MFLRTSCSDAVLLAQQWFNCVVAESKYHTQSVSPLDRALDVRECSPCSPQRPAVTSAALSTFELLTHPSAVGRVGMRDWGVWTGLKHPKAHD